MTITQEEVSAQLDYAIENGFGAELNAMTLEELVVDLQTYSQTCEGLPDEVLTPLVKVWYDARRLGEGDMVTRRIVNPSISGSSPDLPAIKPE